MAEEASLQRMSPVEQEERGRSRGGLLNQGTERSRDRQEAAARSLWPEPGISLEEVAGG